MMTSVGGGVGECNRRGGLGESRGWIATVGVGAAAGCAVPDWGDRSIQPAGGDQWVVISWRRGRKSLAVARLA